MSLRCRRRASGARPLPGALLGLAGTLALAPVATAQAPSVPESGTGVTAAVSACLADTDGAGLSSKEEATFESDYNAKHFSLVTGAVVLNPFALKAVDTDMDPATPEFELETGNTDANVLFEAGFRRRWAWENRQSPKGRTLEQCLAETRRKLARAREDLDPDDAGRLAAESVALERGLRDLRARTPDDPSGVGLASWRSASGDGGGYSWADLGLDTLALVALPDSYTVRLGFVLGSDEPSGAASLAGAGDFYIETGLGFDWLRALYPAGDDVLRVTFGPEVFASFSNDSELNDFHQRVLTGGALGLGAPFGDASERLAELVVRFGYVTLEIPEFLDDSSRLIAVENGVPDFDREAGFGFDVEMNVPITEELGYLFLRATSSHGFDPNPWTTVVGYTLPLNSLVGLVRR